MASTPVIFLLKRSGNSSDRPDAVTVQAGEPALTFGASEPGLYFKDSAGSIRKVGGSHYGTTAPNSSPVGSTGNSVGELWSDSSGAAYYLKVWTGATWQKIGAGFADNATTSQSTDSAVGAPVADIVTTLPAYTADGIIVYKNNATGTPSGIYVAANGGWALA